MLVAEIVAPGDAAQSLTDISNGGCYRPECGIGKSPSQCKKFLMFVSTMLWVRFPAMPDA